MSNIVYKEEPKVDNTLYTNSREQERKVGSTTLNSVDKGLKTQPPDTHSHTLQPDKTDWENHIEQKLDKLEKSHNKKKRELMKSIDSIGSVLK